MSGAPKRGDGAYSLDKYRKDAKGEPFVLAVDVDKTITIPRPTGSVLMDVEEARSSRQIISLLAGDSADELMEVLGAEDFEVMRGVAADMQKHFGLGE